MIHGVRLKAGHASYCNRWVRTERLAQEERAGWALCNKIGDYQGFRALLHMARARLAQALGLLSSANGLGTANTALVWHAGRLLALHEGDLPYQARSGLGGWGLGGAPPQGVGGAPSLAGVECAASPRPAAAVAHRV